MALIYRAIWTDTIDDVAAFMASEFDRWAISKWGHQIDTCSPGTHHGQGQRIDRRTGKPSGVCHELEARITAVADPQPDHLAGVWRGVLAETSPTIGQRWEVTARCWRDTTDRSGRAFLWVDTEVVGDHLDPRNLTVQAPALVSNLIRRGTSPRIGPTPIFVEPRFLAGVDAGEDLAELITDPDRDVPVVVIHADGRAVAAANSNGTDLAAISNRVARAAAGLANLYLVDDTAADTLTRALTRGFGVWGGAMRLYLPGCDPATPGSQARHRYFVPARYTVSPASAVRTITSRVGPLSAAKRPPAGYATVRRVLAGHSGTGGTDADLLMVAQTEVDQAQEAEQQAREEAQQLREDLESVAMDLAIAYEQHTDLQATIESLSRHVVHLQGQLNTSDTFVDTPEVLPTIAKSPSHAARLAQQHLADHLVLPEAALVDLENLDAAPASDAWAVSIWQAFRALHAFAQQCTSGAWDAGGFYQWCQNSKHPRAWSPRQTSLAMKESDTVHTNAKFRRHRILPVDPGVDPSGKVFMEAHIKIGNTTTLAPRIYFLPHRHTVGKGKNQRVVTKVHVGYFGPHINMPNKSS